MRRFCLEEEQGRSLDLVFRLGTHRKRSSWVPTNGQLGIDSFPSLAVGDGERLTHIGLNYTDAKAMLNQIEALIE